MSSIGTPRPIGSRAEWQNLDESLDSMSKSYSEQLLEVERQLEAKPGGGHVQVPAQQLAQLLQAIEQGVPVQAQRRGRLRDRAERAVGLHALHARSGVG